MICEKCGGKLLRLAYGYPLEETLEMAKRGEVILAGCRIDPNGEMPNYQCKVCGNRERHEGVKDSAGFTTDKISEMRDKHLLNTMMMFDKQARELWNSTGDHKGEHIILPANAPMDRLKEASWRNYLPHEYWDLEAEAIKRGLV